MLFSNAHSYENLIKYDNQKTSEMLLAFADHLMSTGQITQKNSDDLRLELNSFNLMNARSPTFLSHYLLEKQNDLIALLQTRYGSLGLHNNMTCYSLRPLIRELAAVFAEMSASLLETSRLHFNRFFYIYHNESCENRTLLSDFLLGKAQGLAALHDRLEECAKNTECFTWHQMVIHSEDDEIFDKEVSRSLGFSQLVSLEEANERATLSRLDIFSVFTILGESLAEMLHQIGRNLTATPQHLAEIEVLLQLAHSEVHRLIGVRDMFSRDLNALEQKRLHYNIILFTLIDVTTHIKENMKSLCRQFSQFKQPSPQNKLPESLKRRVAMQMFNKQISIKKAQHAANAVENYCQVNNITPDALISGELVKISPHLSAESLRTLSDYGKVDTINALYTSKKAKNLEIIKKLMDKFAQAYPKP